MIQVVEESIKFADEDEVERDESYILQIKGPPMTILSTSHKAFFSKDCLSALEESPRKLR